jgi:hypothetical protein
MYGWLVGPKTLACRLLRDPEAWSIAGSSPARVLLLGKHELPPLTTPACSNPHALVFVTG